MLGCSSGNYCEQRCRNCLSLKPIVYQDSKRNGGGLSQSFKVSNPALPVRVI